MMDAVWIPTIPRAATTTNAQNQIVHAGTHEGDKRVVNLGAFERALHHPTRQRAMRWPTQRTTSAPRTFKVHGIKDLDQIANQFRSD